MEITKQTLLALDWADVAAKHLAWAFGAGACSGPGFTGRPTAGQTGLPYYDPEGLNVFGVRMNNLADYYKRGENGFNDFLILVNPGEPGVVVFNATTDPAVTGMNANGDAHLCEGAYNAFVRGNHKGEAGRSALLQRMASVQIVRTKPGQPAQKPWWGFYGINIHNAVGWNKPSAGCQVIEPEGGFSNADKNFALFKAMLQNAPDRDARTYFLMNYLQLETYVGDES